VQYDRRAANSRTTKEKPLERFEQVEKARLKPLPATAYDIVIWKKAKLHRDCYVVFEGSYYSAPFRLVGQKLLICAGSRQVRLFTEKYELVATHERAQKPGERLTHPDHLPKENPSRFAVRPGELPGRCPGGGHSHVASRRGFTGRSGGGSPAHSRETGAVGQAFWR